MLTHHEASGEYTHLVAISDFDLRFLAEIDWQSQNLTSKTMLQGQ